MIEDVYRTLSRYRFTLTSESELQKEIGTILPQAVREYRLDAKNRLDFFLEGIAIEVKIKGGAKDIYKQCERYCAFDEVRSLILITNRSMGFPPEINGKPCYVLKLGRSWL